MGVVIKGENGTVLLREHGVVGKGKAMSNNVAEYAGVLHILKYFSSHPPGRAMIYGDSNLVINQLSGKFKVKAPRIVELYKKALDLSNQFKDIRFEWVDRSLNSEADLLSRIAYAKYKKQSRT